jgi:hypothetical protein
MTRILTLIALGLAAVPTWAFADPTLAPALPLTEQQFVTPDPAPAASPAGADAGPLMGLIRDTLVALLLSVLTAGSAWLTARVAKVTAGKIDLQDVARDLQMETYARAAVDKAFAYALARVGSSWDQLHDVQVRGQMLQYALNFLSSQYPEVVKWIDKDANGVIDWVETHLPAPVQVAQPQALMAAKPARGRPAARKAVVPADEPNPAA